LSRGGLSGGSGLGLRGGRRMSSQRHELRHRAESWRRRRARRAEPVAEGLVQPAAHICEGEKEDMRHQSHISN